MYKYKDPEGRDVVYLEVIEVLPRGPKVGDITWVTTTYEKHIGSRSTCHIEDNRYKYNFKGSSFKKVDKPMKKERSEYRFKTEAEFKRDGNWHNHYGVPEGWGSDKSINRLLGTNIPPKHNKICLDGGTFRMQGENYDVHNYVSVNVPKLTASESHWRFKTEAEFRRDGQWEESYGLPQGWGTDTDLREYLGKTIPPQYNDKCRSSLWIDWDGYDFNNSYAYISVNVPQYNYIPIEPVEETVDKPLFRFKTKEEFIECNDWSQGLPAGWKTDELHLLGTPIPAHCNDTCETGDSIRVEGGIYVSAEYTSIDTPKPAGPQEIVSIQDSNINPCLDILPLASRASEMCGGVGDGRTMSISKSDPWQDTKETQEGEEDFTPMININ